jgi:pimeloyl-ACP methyl ester carboxylesterase
MRIVLLGVGGLLVSWLVLTLVLRFVAQPSGTEAELDRRAGKRLVVLVHGLSGRDSMQPLVDLAREAYDDADILTFRYDARPLSNADVFGVANQLESEIHAAFESQPYDSIVLAGHSLGAMLLRKALLWAYGIEDDRRAPKGARVWSTKVVRVVSLAGINRGWSVDERPDQMPLSRYVSFRFGRIVARLTGTGQMMLAVERGSPFIADSRVQWIRLTRGTTGDGSRRRMPQVIHLLGDSDDVVSRQDATDLGVATDTVFVTLAGTNHADIVNVRSPRRRDEIRYALLGEMARLSPDRTQTLTEDPNVRRVIFLMHGIRDYGGWTDRVREEIQAQTAAMGGYASGQVAVVNKKYGYFPMLRFLIYGDRQRNVRRFMDEYTENVARYPNASEFDFVGHSNGTYILASALQRYRTIRIGRVYFAGSVVPTHYPWRRLADEGRVARVVNIVASGDWVVAIFPKLFEQCAYWLNTQPTSGLMDIGAGGFRGFQAADDPIGRIANVQFAEGTHGVAVDTQDEAKLAAIVAYVLRGDENGFAVFRRASAPWGWLNVLSNVSWLVWIALIVIVGAIGYGSLSLHTGAGVTYGLVLLAVLMSI